VGLAASFGNSKSSSETTTNVAQAVSTLYTLFGGSDGKYSLALPMLRIPGATGGSVDWKKLTKQIATAMSQS
jgi:hypothetical protein